MVLRLVRDSSGRDSSGQDSPAHDERSQGPSTDPKGRSIRRDQRGRMWRRIVVFSLLVSLTLALEKRDAAHDIKKKYGDLKENCFPRPGVKAGCRCTFKNDKGEEQVKLFDNKSECVKPVVVQTAENKAKLNQEFKEKMGGLRDGCFPLPKGCRCTEKDAQGADIVKKYANIDECRGPTAEDKENKAKVNEELEKKFGGLKENCYPRAGNGGKGCRCTAKDSQGNEQTKYYDTDAECKVELVEGCTETECKIRQKREYQRDRSPSQNVRDPVREKAQANYQAVINELKQKFAGLKDGCFPRPKGCVCVVGKDVDGHEITERRMKDTDCKCQPGERGPGCPADGA
ncbi:unnamed protein product [Bursaphelenchus xylophilus]|uniref:(pine wood nematode) hypothetical protein n=1 Tax=Bursaphelenchus xylophilus TaxID=6326 RepID=A0A7I8WTP1_BURXY|nr:unnamed protein product [Bursaphelenchus xylophilus]CAG9116062.1 unnamed protein product [Bursaphelenchus xylophilus]